MALPMRLFGALLVAFPAAAMQLMPGSKMFTGSMLDVFVETAPLTEKGYLAVAELKSDDAMKAFIHRLCESEARYVKDVSELSGLVPYYSGEKAVQSLDSLRSELRRVAWVGNGEGRTAALNENGYQQVARRKSNAHMTAFARRILDELHIHVADEGAFKGLVVHHSGEVAVQSFAKLKQDLFDASFAKYLQFPDAGPTPQSSIDEPIASSKTEAVESNEVVSDDNVPLTEQSFAATPTEKEEFEDEDIMAAFRAFDLDGSSGLSTAELKQAVKSLHQELSDDAVEEMFKGVDADGSGEIDAEEFKAAESRIDSL